MANTKIDISLVIPCLNEVRGLPFALASAQKAQSVFEKNGFISEIIVSDNGSQDGSQVLAGDRGARVVDCPRRGYGSALHFGIRAANGRWIIMGDADGAHDFCDAVPMIEKLRLGDDFCVGSRMRGKIMPGAMRWKNRYIGNPILTGLLNFFFHSKFSDAHCGLRAFTREAFSRMNLSSEGMEFASEMIVKAMLLKLKCSEIPITVYPEKRDRPPHLRPWKDGWRHLRFLLMYGPLWLFFLPAFFLMSAGALIYALVYSVPPYHTFSIGFLEFGDHWMILSGGWVIVGFQIFILGMLALHARQELGMFPLTKMQRKLSDLVTFENTLLLGGVTLILACVVLAAIFRNVFTRTNPVLFQIREMMLVTTLFVMTAQAWFSGLFYSMVGSSQSGAPNFRKDS